MLVFLFVDAGIIATVVMPLGAAIGTAAFLGALTVAAILVRTRQSEAAVGLSLPSQGRRVGGGRRRR
jgi:hypothetical protein